ncbi:putative calcium/proton exchanger, sodium/calcium exchanger membrane region [Helianthus annuus]|nr:putative calcium/proton exchanger, sodium/calcium exchanger membrane region [Helianthus annuus]
MKSSSVKSMIELQDDSRAIPVATTRNLPSLKGGPELFGTNSAWSIMKASIKTAFFSDKINLLLPCGPLAMLVDQLTHRQGWVFMLSLLGIIPLAERLVGGLLNATFGNATELIISLFAMKQGMLRLVQQSLLGSILSNMLLVLGCALFGGGITHLNKEQMFNKLCCQSNVGMSVGLLLMAVMALIFPTVLRVTNTELQIGTSVLALSRFCSCIMLVAYVVYIFFLLTNQKQDYASLKEVYNHLDKDRIVQYVYIFLLIVQKHQDSPTASSDNEESADITKWESIIWLGVLTLFISILSDYLVNAIEGASVAMDVPVAFISVILLPIVGNAAEHASAIMFAVKDKLDISLGVAIGSSTQISMFVMPICVVVGWMIERPLDLDFEPFETATLFMTVLVVAFILQEGTSNYFKGLMLLFCYMIVAASFYVHVDPASIREFLRTYRIYYHKFVPFY